MFEFLVSQGLSDSVFRFCVKITILALFCAFLIHSVFNEKKKNNEILMLMIGVFSLASAFAAYLSFCWYLVLAGDISEVTSKLTQRSSIVSNNADYRKLVDDCARFNFSSGAFACKDKILELMLKNVKESDIADKRVQAVGNSAHWDIIRIDGEPLPATVGLAVFVEDLALTSLEREPYRSEVRQKFKRIAPHLFNYYEKEMVRLANQKLTSYNVVTHKNDTLFRYIVTELNLDCYGLTGQNCEKLRESARSIMYKKASAARELKESLTAMADSLK